MGGRSGTQVDAGRAGRAARAAAAGQRRRRTAARRSRCRGSRRSRRSRRRRRPSRSPRSSRRACRSAPSAVSRWLRRHPQPAAPIARIDTSSRDVASVTSRLSEARAVPERRVRAERLDHLTRAAAPGDNGSPSRNEKFPDGKRHIAWRHTRARGGVTPARVLRRLLRHFAVSRRRRGRRPAIRRHNFRRAVWRSSPSVGGRPPFTYAFAISNAYRIPVVPVRSQ